MRKKRIGSKIRGGEKKKTGKIEKEGWRKGK